MRGQAFGVLAAALAVAASQGQALVPLPPCEGVVEAGMAIHDTFAFGDFDAPTDYVVELYFNAQTLENNVYVDLPAPVPALRDFYGTRITSCATGEFLAIDGVKSDQVNASLSATEFLRDDLKAGRKISFRQIRRAAEAVYGKVLVLRETEETCGCAMYRPELRPRAMTAFEKRVNVVR